MPTSPRGFLSRTESMQKLQILSAQQEVLQRRLSLHVPCALPHESSTAEYGSLSNSPTLSRSSSIPESDGLHATTQPIPTQPGVPRTYRVDVSHADDSQRLCEINQSIKATLTDLLNTDSVRSDDRYRQYIQGRLMEIERQIRRQRHRRSSVGRDTAFAATIATNMSPTSPSRHSWH